MAKNGDGALFMAAENGHKDIVDMLLAAGANIEAALSNGATPLFIAAQNGHNDVVGVLLAAGANIEAALSNGASPLYIAAQNGRKDIVDMLLKAGANLEAAMNTGATPLCIAARGGHKDIVGMLLGAGANIGAAMSTGATPLYLAALNGSKDIVDMLLAAGANTEAALSNGATPLSIAAQKGHKDVIAVLLAAKANIDAKRNDNVTPLNAAVYNGFKEIVAMLLAAGANIEEALSNGATPLFIAAQNGFKDIVDMLLAAGAKIEAAMSNGATPLYIAAKQGYTSIVSVLLQNAASITTPSFNNISVLEYARAHTFHERINKLILTQNKWVPKTQSDIALFDIIFRTEAPVGERSEAINVSTCPVCFVYTLRTEACNYMKHKCPDHKGYYHSDLYKKYKNSEGYISWCTICGRICSGHRHYSLSDPTAPIPPFAAVTQANPFANDCRGEGGGGLEEKFRRFRRAREVMKELEPTLSFDEAMDILIEEMWRAPLSRLPLKSKMNEMRAAKKFTNYPTENFPENKKSNAVAEKVNKEIKPLAPSQLPVLVKLSTPVMNSVSMDDITTILHLKHGSSSVNKPDAHLDEVDPSKDVSRIGIVGFFDVLKSNMDKGDIGMCWKYPECQTPLHPDEVDEVLRLADKEGILDAVFIELAKRYRGLFTTKFGKSVVTTGIKAAGGAGANRRTRRLRKQSGGGESVIDQIRKKFAPATDATCVLQKRAAKKWSNRRYTRRK